MSPCPLQTVTIATPAGLLGHSRRKDLDKKEKSMRWSVASQPHCTCRYLTWCHLRADSWLESSLAGTSRLSQGPKRGLAALPDLAFGTSLTSSPTLLSSLIALQPGWPLAAPQPQGLCTCRSLCLEYFTSPPVSTFHLLPCSIQVSAPVSGGPT